MLISVLITSFDVANQLSDQSLDSQTREGLAATVSNLPVFRDQLTPASN